MSKWHRFKPTSCKYQCNHPTKHQCQNIFFVAFPNHSAETSLTHSRWWCRAYVIVVIDLVYGSWFPKSLPATSAFPLETFNHHVWNVYICDICFHTHINILILAVEPHFTPFYASIPNHLSWYIPTCLCPMKLLLQLFGVPYCLKKFVTLAYSGPSGKEKTATHENVQKQG